MKTLYLNAHFTKILCAIYLKIYTFTLYIYIYAFENYEERRKKTHVIGRQPAVFFHFYVKRERKKERKKRKR